MPGLVDLAARLREPGFEYRATLESEMEAAMAGGVTSLAIPPDTDPVLDEPGLVEMLCYRAKSSAASCLRSAPSPSGSRENACPEMAELVEAGCVAFSQANTPIIDSIVLMAMQYAATFGFRVSPVAPFLARAASPTMAKSPHGSAAGVPAAAETIGLYTPSNWPASPARNCTSPACPAPKA